MDLDQLRTFTRIVREGSFVRAAWSLGIGQPTVSARIKALEREIGGPLFIRGRRVQLTERGTGFLPYARRALNSLQDGLEEARLAHTEARGRLSISALRSLTGAFLAPALAHYCTRYPQVECLVREGRHGEVVEHLGDGVTELGLLCWPPQDPLLADLKATVHLREPVVLVVSQGHRLAGRGEVRADELLADGQLLLLLRWWEALPSTLLELTAHATAVADVPMDTGRFLVQRGLGIGFFPRMVIAPDIQAGQVVEVKVRDLPPLTRDSALAYLSRHTHLSGAALPFVELVREEARRLGLLI